MFCPMLANNKNYFWRNDFQQTLRRSQNRKNKKREREKIAKENRVVAHNFAYDPSWIPSTHKEIGVYQVTKTDWFSGFFQGGMEATE